MQDFTIVQYSSDASEQFYGYWFNRITTQFKMQEKLTVLDGKRKQFIDIVDIDKFEQFEKFIKDNNLYYVVLNITSKPIQYSQTANGGKDALRVLVSTEQIHQPKDSLEIGKLLGYPSEDIDFFINVYEKQKYIDTTWWQVNDKFKVNDTKKVLEYGSYQSTLLRWFGVRFVPNLPRDFYQCDSQKFAQMFIDTMLKYNHKKEVDIATQLLHSHIEYNTYNGIGIVQTEQFRQLFYSPNYEQGVKYTIVQQGEQLQDADKNLWLFNGFSKYQTMVESHEMLINILNEIKQIDVCDLGQGNGLLIMNVPGKKIQYEIDETKINWHKQHFQWSGVEFIKKNITEFGNEDVDTYLVSVNRLIDTPDIGAKIYDTLIHSRKRFVIYHYGNIDDDKFYNILENNQLDKFVIKSAQLTTEYQTLTVQLLGQTTTEVSA